MKTLLNDHAQLKNKTKLKKTNLETLLNETNVEKLINELF